VAATAQTRTCRVVVEDLLQGNTETIRKALNLIVQAGAVAFDEGCISRMSAKPNSGGLTSNEV